MGRSQDYLVKRTAYGDHTVEFSLELSPQEKQQAKTQVVILLAVVGLVLALIPPLIRPSALVSRTAALCLDYGLRAALCALLWKIFPRAVVEERLLAIRGLGVQTFTTRADGSVTSRFLDAHSIKAILVNEGIQSCDVRYYLAITVAGQKNLCLVFDHFRPRLPVLSVIFRRVHRCIFPSQH